MYLTNEILFAMPSPRRTQPTPPGGRRIGLAAPSILRGTHDLVMRLCTGVPDLTRATRPWAPGKIGHGTRAVSDHDLAREKRTFSDIWGFPPTEDLARIGQNRTLSILALSVNNQRELRKYLQFSLFFARGTMTSGRVCDFLKFREISFLELFLDFYYLGSGLELFFEISGNFIFGTIFGTSLCRFHIARQNGFFFSYNARARVTVLGIYIAD